MFFHFVNEPFVKKMKFVGIPKILQCFDNIYRHFTKQRTNSYEKRQLLSVEKNGIMMLYVSCKRKQKEE